MRIAVCDDELLSIQKFIDVLKSYLSEIHLEHEIDMYDDELELLKNVQDGIKYDIYISDIDMRVQGDQLIKQIRLYDNEFLTAFVSSYENKGSVVCHARGDAYIYKSMTSEEMLQEIKRLFTLFFRNKQSYRFRTASGFADIELRKIKYIESCKREIVVHIIDEPDFTVFGHTLSSLESAGAFCRFARVDRSHLVNYQGVQSADDKTIRFDDGEELVFPKEKVERFRRQWRDFILEEFL